MPLCAGIGSEPVLNNSWAATTSLTCCVPAGTGGKPELGEQAAQESQESLAAAVGNADMVSLPAHTPALLHKTASLVLLPFHAIKCLISITDCPKTPFLLTTPEHSLCAGQFARSAGARLPLLHICCLTVTC